MFNPITIDHHPQIVDTGLLNIDIWRFTAIVQAQAGGAQRISRLVLQHQPHGLLTTLAPIAVLIGDFQIPLAHALQCGILILAAEKRRDFTLRQDRMLIDLQGNDAEMPLSLADVGVAGNVPQRGAAIVDAQRIVQATDLAALFGCAIKDIFKPLK
ncbi:hypothetical protein ABFV80_001261 [Vandammella animalimorsus]|uniref:hypothetical protein n=1 Tax=Vandammella animalimorsus TaxID=2029117 RepID=UPI000BAA5CD7|nr:hypothetical protein CK626_12105 [Vandammella animalimorsus]